MCTFDPGNFTGWGSEGVKHTLLVRAAKCHTVHILLLLRVDLHSTHSEVSYCMIYFLPLRCHTTQSQQTVIVY